MRAPASVATAAAVEDVVVFHAETLVRLSPDGGAVLTASVELGDSGAVIMVTPSLIELVARHRGTIVT